MPQPDQATKQLGKMAKNVDMGKLTEAEKSSTGQVYKDLTKRLSCVCTVCEHLTESSFYPGQTLCVLGISESHWSSSVLHKSTSVLHPSWSFTVLQLLVKLVD